MLREASIDLADGVLHIWLRGDHGAEVTRQSDLRGIDHTAMLQLSISWEFGHAAQALEDAEIVKGREGGDGAGDDKHAA
jgi:hypothetical protein